MEYFKPGDVMVQKLRIMPRQLRKPTKNKKIYVETYSSSNAGAIDPEERVQKKMMTKLH